MNDLVKIQLFRLAATMPWAEIETTQHNIRITYYDGPKEDAPKTVLVSADEAKDIAKALTVLADHYTPKQDGEL